MSQSRIRVIDLETAGNGPYDVCEIGWQDVVLEAGGSWQVNEDRGAYFVNPLASDLARDHGDPPHP